MDYEKLYKDALERAKKLYEQGTITESLSNVFPELKESEDERIRKKLIKYFQDLKGGWFGNISHDDILAWLEKQGEQKTFDYEDATIQQKYFAPKPEPKFKVGDWVVCEITGSVYQIKNCIENLNNHRCGYDLTNGGYIGSDEVNLYHLWTLQDAKDGDVLVHNSITFIFKGIEVGIVKGLCSELSDSILNFGEPEYDKDYYPATKEQRDLLFQKMKESGYEWDAEKKDFRKIENYPILSNSAKTGKNWSDEDEELLQHCCGAIAAADYYTLEDKEEMENWLKSLKQRWRNEL